MIFLEMNRESYDTEKLNRIINKYLSSGRMLQSYEIT